MNNFFTALKDYGPIALIGVVFSLFMATMIVLTAQGTITLGYTVGTWVWPFGILAILVQFIVAVVVVNAAYVSYITRNRSQK